VRIRILYDNEAQPGYKADWGFACLIEGQERILFDTGADPAILQSNMEAAGVRPDDLDKVVLSHDHWDHTGGLSYVCGNSDKLTVLVLPSFGAEVRSLIRPPLSVEEVTKPGEVSPGVFTTGPMEGLKQEQALFLETGSGLVLITGCAHPGVDALMRRAESYGPIYAVLGGFHGFDDLAALDGIAFLAPCHCTQQLHAIRERYPDTCRQIAAGVEMEFRAPIARALGAVARECGGPADGG
jgi:7,8-dihydropterin-6-yl-methyl-4-(beta-D-ribofuranosyl)aminobenzene 5'-phosphate synthase